MPNTPLLFPLGQDWPLYAGFFGLVLALLALDLGVFNRRAHRVSAKEALGWTLFWIGLAGLFNLALFLFADDVLRADARLQSIPGFNSEAAGHQAALEFLTGYVVEKALAVDNMFVFVVIFTYFNIPAEHQHRVLFFGVLGALVFRSAFIALGSVLFTHGWVVVVFGIFLILTGLKILVAPSKGVDPERNPALRLVRRLLPVSAGLHGSRFLVRENGRWLATPLLVALACVEVSDVIFAVDSVPAIFAITREPFLVLTSNLFAILGLRSMYFLLAGAVEKFRYLKYGLGVVLTFVGLKMAWLNGQFGGHFPIGWSLGIIAGVLALAVAASLLTSRHDGRAAATPSAPGA